ncbi:magnesium chelatase [Sesbania bispinosa]|nr:magnesium chelatase [Sesbania bispinosa]
MLKIRNIPIRRSNQVGDGRAKDLWWIEDTSKVKKEIKQARTKAYENPRKTVREGESYERLKKLDVQNLDDLMCLRRGSVCEGESCKPASRGGRELRPCGGRRTSVTWSVAGFCDGEGLRFWAVVFYESARVRGS